MLNWNITNYEQSQEKEKVPSALKIEIFGTDIILHKHVFYEGWLLSSRSMGIEKYQLASEDLEECKSKAINIVLTRIKNKINIFSKTVEQLEGVMTP